MNIEIDIREKAMLIAMIKSFNSWTPDINDQEKFLINKICKKLEIKSENEIYKFRKCI